jgi:hypothetical protein
MTLYMFTPLLILLPQVGLLMLVSFKLYNKNSSPDDFMTYFTADSDPEFSITPKMGSFSSSLNDP